MKKLDIAVIGYGFVGKAVAHGFQNNNITLVDPTLGEFSSKDLTGKFDAVFVCVPTPMSEDGTINSSIVEGVLEDLRDLDTLLVLKSTVVPSIVDRLSKTHANFLYNPEFLTERNALLDFEYPFMQVYGGSPENTAKLSEIYRHSICEPCPEYHMSAVEASFVKYGINTFLSTKLSFWNQFYDMCDKIGADYNTIKTAIGTDVRVGSGHMNVPGHDGRRGFGGACLQKDSNAFMKESIGSMTVLIEAVKFNNAIRSQYADLLDREKEQGVSFKKAGS